MRRLALGLAGFVGAAAVAVPLLAARAPVDDAGDRLLAGLAQATGLSVQANGRSEVSLFPRPRVRVEGVSLAHEGEPPFAVARGLTGTLDPLALLQGRIKLGELILDQPQIALDRLPYADVLSALRSNAAVAPPSIRLSDGRLQWKGRVADKIEGGLVWPRDGGSFTLSGYGRFGGRPVEAKMQLADVAAFARGERAPFRARLEGGGARVLFDGDTIDEGGLKLVGDVSVRASELADTLGWLGARPSPAKAASGWGASFAGRGQLDASGLQISNGELDLAGRSFLGAGRVTAGPAGPAVEATLDAGSIDLKPYLALLAPEVARPDGTWSARSVDLDGLRGWTLDLRLSADEMRLGGLTLERPALTAAVAEGGLDLSIGEASAYGGAVGGRLSIEPDGAVARLRFEGGATDLALGEALEALAGRRPLAGTLTAEVAVESEGSSIQALVAGLRGQAKARLADGLLATRSRSRTLALAGLGDKIEFARAEAAMVIKEGVARADPVSIEGPHANFTLAGDASLVDRELSLRGFVKPSGAAWTLPVRLTGPLFEPKLRPDLSGRPPRGEASRSGAGPTEP